MNPPAYQPTLITVSPRRAARALDSLSGSSNATHQ